MPQKQIQGLDTLDAKEAIARECNRTLAQLDSVDEKLKVLAAVAADRIPYRRGPGPTRSTISQPPCRREATMTSVDESVAASLFFTYVRFLARAARRLQRHLEPPSNEDYFSAIYFRQLVGHCR